MSAYEDQCVAAVQDLRTGEVRRCQRPTALGRGWYLEVVPICAQHYDKARRQFAHRIEDELAELKATVAAHECDGDRAVAAHIHETYEGRAKNLQRRKSRTQAYFIRCGSFIKIGAGQSPLGRLETIRKTGGILAPAGLDLATAELIATEPGGFVREKELHQQFAHLRHTGEWFTEAPELTEYIERLDIAA